MRIETGRMARSARRSHHHGWVRLYRFPGYGFELWVGDHWTMVQR